MRRWQRRLGGGLAVALLAVALFLALDRCFPLTLPKARSSFAVVVTARDGTPLRAFADAQGVWRYPVTLDQVSPLYLQALLNYEDRWYWHHPGINPVAMVRALGQDLLAGRIVSGGSTLTMQVARIIAPSPHTVTGKLKQIFHALQLEWHLSKKQILTLYLNYAPFGGTLEGVQAASFAYLGKPAKDLTPAEAALLAVLPQAPSRLRPDRAPKLAEAARNKVLDRLQSYGVWSATRVRRAKQEHVAAWPLQRPMLSPLLARRLADDAHPGHPLKTTIDADVQARLQNLARDYSSQLPPGTSTAILVVDNRDLAVKAYVGSADLLDRSRFGYVDMTQAVRSPGSTLKPFLYGIAIQNGLIDSASLLLDAPRSFDDYRPSDFSGGFEGPVTAEQALQRSLNVPAVDLLNRVGPAYFDARLREGGLNLTFPAGAKPNLSMILGGVGARLEDLVAAYTALARGGKSGDLRYRTDTPLHEHPMLSAGAAWIVRRMLTTPPPNEAAPWATVQSADPIAWKTGTSYGFRDAWSIGVNRRYTVGVWVGRPDGTPVPGHYGAVTAAPLMFHAFAVLPPGQILPAQPPASVTQTTVCWPLGTAPRGPKDPDCQRRFQAWTYDGMIPRTFPDPDDNKWLGNPVQVRVNSTNGKRLSAGCDVPDSRVSHIALWPRAALPWLPPRLRQSGRLPPVDPTCGASVPPLTSLHITSLQPNSIVRPAGAAGQAPTVTLSAEGGSGKLYWLLDSQQIALTRSGEDARYTLRHPGRFQLTVFDDAGNFDSVELTVE